MLQNSGTRAGIVWHNGSR